jgi:hypothetical protein
MLTSYLGMPRRRDPGARRGRAAVGQECADGDLLAAALAAEPVLWTGL